MRKLTWSEYKCCQYIGEVFELSLKYSNFSSSMFIRRFMLYSENHPFFDTTYLMMSCNLEDIILELNEKYQPSEKKILIDRDVMYWIGYVYGALSYLFERSSRVVYKLFPAREIIKYYNAYHTFDIEEAAERMMENVGIKYESKTERGVKILRELYAQEIKSCMKV